MKKIHLLILGLLSPSIAFSACPDKLAVCKNWESITVNQKWNWKKAKCELCQTGCGNTYSNAQSFCSGKDKFGYDRKGLAIVNDMKNKILINLKRSLYLNDIKKKD